MLDRDLLLDAAEWRLIGVLFEYPSGNWRELVVALAGEVRDSDLRSAAEAAAREASEGMHHSLFGPGGPVPPREASYTRAVQLGYLLGEIAAYYGAFAYQPQPPEPHDHVAVETGFVAYLKLKEAYAIATGDDQHAAITREAVERFCAEHLSMIAAPIAQALEPIAPSYLVLAGRALVKRVGPPRAPVTGVVSSDEADMTCGIDPADAFIQLPG